MKDILAMGAQPDLVSCQTKVISTHIKTEISTTMSGKPDQLRKLLTMPPRPRQEAKMSQKRPRMKYYLLMMEFMKKLKRKRPAAHKKWVEDHQSCDPRVSIRSSRLVW